MGGGGKGKSGGKGKGKGKGKTGSRGPPPDTTKKFQVQLKGEWNDYGREEDVILKKAFLVGHEHVQYNLRGQDYKYSFGNMTQINVHTGKERQIRKPPGMEAPSKPLLPPGNMVIITVRPGQPGTTIEVPHPTEPGEVIPVQVPKSAKPGQKMAVPIPAPGETVADVAKKQKKWSKTKMAGTAVGMGLAVGGVLLIADHATDGAVSDWAADAGADAADAAADGADAVADWVADADVGAMADDVGDWVGDAAEDVGDWVGGAADDIGDWAADFDAGDAAADVGDAIAGAAEDVADWAGDIDVGDVAGDVGDFVGDAGDWLGDTAEDVGDFVMSLF